ncbi:MAG: hypothetical protein QM723_35820 [Myxococcaceae bacterium]
MSQLPIDLDAEAILFDSHWCTRDELARRIRGMLDSGDYAITRHSAALELLTQTLNSVRTVAFRSTPDLVEAINMNAARAGKSVGGYIRDVLMEALGGQMQPHENQEAAPTAPAASPGPQVPIAGPGALRASGLHAAQPPSTPLPSVMVEPALADETAVELTQPKKKEEESAERRWFNP